MWTFTPCRLALQYCNASALPHFVPIVLPDYAILLYLEPRGLPSLSDSVRARRCGAAYPSLPRGKGLRVGAVSSEAPSP
jgi:hypothetical protein